jgi:hypothetical protein
MAHCVRAVRPVVVTGVLVAHHRAVWLKECLDALSLQTGPLDRLVIADTGSSGDGVRIAASHARIGQVVGNVEAISAPHGSIFGDAMGRAVWQITTQSSSKPAPAPSQAALNPSDG